MADQQINNEVQAEPAIGSPVANRFSKFGAQLDVERGKQNRFASFVPTEAIPASTPQPKTTVEGLRDAALRGMAPYGTLASGGAGIGFLVAGPPGAAVGAAGSVAGGVVLDLAGAVYNPIAAHFDLPHLLTTTEAANNIMDMMGFERPDTPLERITQAGVGAATGAGALAKSAGKLSEIIENPTVQATLNSMAQDVWLQTVSGATGAISGQSAAEAHMGPLTQFLASLAGAGAPLGAKAGFQKLTTPPPLKPIVTTPAAKAAHENGYVIPPKMAGKPGTITATKESIAGKIQTEQLASSINQGRTNQLAKQALGISEDMPLTKTTFDQVRREAGKAYKTISEQDIIIKPDNIFFDSVAKAKGTRSEAVQYFGSAIKNTDVDNLTISVGKTQPFPPRVGIAFVRDLRFKATKNLKSLDNPERVELGLAQREIADAVDDLIERHLDRIGQKQLSADYKAARIQIAKSHDIETATNFATEEISALELAKLYRKGKPFTDELRIISDAANSFPRAMKPPSSFGGVEEFSTTSFGTAGLATVVSGNPMPIFAFFGRPRIRALLLSDKFQEAMLHPGLQTPASKIQLATKPLTKPALITSQMARINPEENE